MGDTGEPMAQKPSLYRKQCSNRSPTWCKFESMLSTTLPSTLRWPPTYIACYAKISPWLTVIWINLHRYAYVYVQGFYTRLVCLLDLNVTSIPCVKVYVWVWVSVSVLLHWLNRSQLTSLRLCTPPQMACRGLCPPAHPSGYLWTADQDFHQGWWLWFLPDGAPSQETARLRKEEDQKWSTKEGTLYD